MVMQTIEVVEQGCITDLRTSRLTKEDATALQMAELIHRRRNAPQTFYKVDAGSFGIIDDQKREIRMNWVITRPTFRRKIKPINDVPEVLSDWSKSLFDSMFANW